MIRRAISRSYQAARAPAVHRLIDATESRSLPLASVSLSIGASIERALDRLETGSGTAFGDRFMLIPDQRRSGTPGPRLTFAVVSWLATWSTVTIGLPAVVDGGDRRRWRSLADKAGASLTILGSAGWNRVEFGDRSLILKHADTPAELHAGTPVVALSAPAGSGCLALWGGIVHPNTAMRARLAPNAEVELSAVVDAVYLLVGQVGSSWMAAWATRPVVAELVARGVERSRERQAGIEGAGPWEDAGVQHLSDIGQSGVSVASLVLHAWLEDNDDEGLAHNLGEMLGWRLDLGDDNGTGGVGG